MGVKNVRQAQENAGVLGWYLTKGEIAALDEVSERVQPFLSSSRIQVQKSLPLAFLRTYENLGCGLQPKRICAPIY